MTLKAIKAKIKSVKNLKKITRALEVVSTVKLQKTKDQAENMREYLKDLLFVLSAIWGYIDLFSSSKVENSDKELCILITSDRWLCWNLNSKLLRKFYEETKSKKDNIDVFVVGKKWLEYAVRLGYNVVWSINLKDNFSEENLLPLYTFVEKNLFNYKQGYLYFNYFKNTLVQIPTKINFYPLSEEVFSSFVESLGIENYDKPNIKGKDLLIEPDIETLIKEVKRQIRNYLIYSAILQNKTGEHAARMIAMKNAKDNSEKMIKSLTLSFNKARQAAITKEISEITSAKMAIEEGQN